VLGPFSYAFAQRALLELVLLSLGTGLLGTWIVARGLAFYSHAVAAAAFPGLVLAAGVGFSPLLGAFASGAAFALAVGELSARPRTAYDALTALALVGALASGIVLASDVFHSGSDVDTLLFGSVFAIHPSDLRFAIVLVVAAALGTITLGPRWLAVGFDPQAARGLGVRSRGSDLALLGLVALAAVACLAAVGSLLAAALLVVPAVTTRLWVDRVWSWQLVTVALTAVEGAVGLWLSLELNAPPGATIATLGGILFALSVVIRSHLRHS
jgi:ABC-type Mn2+/Zn2+ transport system permease subunit